MERLRESRSAAVELEASELRRIMRYLGVSDGNMQEGSFRCDANVSVRLKEHTEFGTRTELKNINSFRFLERAINYEVERQIDLIESGGKVVQETRLYDADKDETRSMRSKEEANDYRYFPDPDLLPVEISDAMIDAVRASLPEMPDVRRERFESEFGLSRQDAESLTASREMADYFETANGIARDAKQTANWIMGELSAAMNRESRDINTSPVTAELLGGMVKRIADNTISGKIAKDVFEAMWNGEGSADDIIEAKGLKQITDTGAIEAIVDEVLASNPQQVENFRNAPDDKKGKMIGFFVGQVMKASKGKANPQQVNQLLREKL